jgi:hypothetical protein
MPDAVYNWPVTCVCRTDRASVEFAQVHLWGARSLLGAVT